MKKITCVLAILAAASTAAVAKDLKQDKKASAPTVKATVMSDSEMDKVTAGATLKVSPASIHAGPGQPPIAFPLTVGAAPSPKTA
jgi:hypothetical protein